MNWKKKLFKESGLYIILDKDACCNIFSTASKITKTGSNIVQLRAKNAAKKELLSDALRLKRMFRNRAIFIINDHVDIARAARADGVHLGQDDLPIKEARKILGKKSLIGVSCHSLKQALIAQKEGADYIGIGPIFKTLTKPECKIDGPGILGKLRKNIKIPVFAIGGINRKNLRQITSKGISKVAVCRDVCLSKNIPVTIKEFKDALHDANRAG